MCVHLLGRGSLLARTVHLLQATQSPRKVAKTTSSCSPVLQLHLIQLPGTLQHRSPPSSSTAGSSTRFHCTKGQGLTSKGNGSEGERDRKRSDKSMQKDETLNISAKHNLQLPWAGHGTAPRTPCSQLFNFNGLALMLPVPSAALCFVPSSPPPSA